MDPNATWQMLCEYLRHCTRIRMMRKYAPMSLNCSGHSLAGSAGEDSTDHRQSRCVSNLAPKTP